jgi:integrase
MSTTGIRRRCRCRDENGKDLGARCPNLAQRKHGSWQVQQELERHENGKRRFFRREGFETKTLAEACRDRVRELLNIADDEDDRRAVSALLMSLSPKESLPSTEEVRRQLRAGQQLGDKLTVGEWLDRWIVQQTHLRRATRRLYENQIRLYLKPKIGHLRLDRLTVGHLAEMFASIADDNDKIEAENADRRALEQRVRETSKRAEKRALREQLAEMPPYRRPVYGASQQRIRGCLRKAINDAIVQQLATFNAAEHVVIQAKRHKPIVWTAERIAQWRETGQRPGPVCVWTPAHAGTFLDFVVDEDPEFEALWHIATFRGLRRGELAGLPWTEVDLDAGTVQVSTQITEVDYEPEEGEVKSSAGERTIPLDDQGVQLLHAHRKRQVARKLELGAAWQESGKVFTGPDGSPLRPSWISDRFARLLTDAGLPPIRLHDLRHTAATLMLAAGVDMKVVQETLGHSALAVTADLYTSVLPELAKAAAEATTAIVPRRARAGGKPAEHPRNTQRIPGGLSAVGGAVTS